MHLALSPLAWRENDIHLFFILIQTLLTVVIHVLWALLWTSQSLDLEIS